MIEVSVLRDYLIAEMCHGIKRGGKTGKTSEWRGMAKMISHVARTDSEAEYEVAWLEAKSQTGDWLKERQRRAFEERQQRRQEKGIDKIADERSDR